VIACCGSVGGGAFSCPDLEAVPGGKNVLFEEALGNKFFQVPSEASTMDGLMSLAVLEEAVL